MSLTSFFNLSIGYRVLVVISIFWTLATLIITDPWARIVGGRTYRNWDEFLLWGIVPVIVIWGITWIIQGLRKK